MLYRSLLKLDLLDPSVQRALHDVNDMHRNLMKAFDDLPSESPREKASLLYSLMDRGGRPCVYVFSALKPDWSKVRGFDPCDEPREISALKDQFKVGNSYAFRLFASPTKKVSREGKLSARVFLRSVAERSEWLTRHATAGGFSLLSVTEQTESRISGSKNGSSIRYTGILFTGVLRIEDAEKFWKTYCGGLGPGKAYGLGMLLVRRL